MCPDTLAASRKKAAHRRRRIIYNNDGCDAWLAQAPTPEAFPATRAERIVRSQVDSVFYCTTLDTGNYWHRSKIAQLCTEPSPHIELSQRVRLVEALAQRDMDTLALSVDYLHRHGRDILWSHRMNPMESMGHDWILSDFKRDHPEWWLGKTGDDEKYPSSDQRHWYRVFDYGVPEVREYMLAVTAEVLENYDVDGVELDYLRDPYVFKETFSDPVVPVTEEHCAVMLDFHAKIREMLDAKARRIGRPLLLALRVPKWVHLSKRIGVDIEAHLKAGLVDLLVGSGGYTPFAPPPVEFIELAHRYDVPAHLCISSSGMFNRFKLPASARETLGAWRGAAMNLFDCGADGPYVFNTNVPNLPATAIEDQILGEIGDPVAMRGKDMVFAIDSWEPMRSHGWVITSVQEDGLLPIRLAGDGDARALHVGADIAGDGYARATLRAYFSDDGDKGKVTLKWNERALTDGDDRGAYLCFAIPPESIVKGDNRLWAASAPGGPSELVHVELEVTADEQKPSSA